MRRLFFAAAAFAVVACEQVPYSDNPKVQNAAVEAAEEVIEDLIESATGRTADVEIQINEKNK